LTIFSGAPAARFPNAGGGGKAAADLVLLPNVAMAGLRYEGVLSALI
jgi:hypothetical protein